MDKNKINEATARVLLSTKRKSRLYSLYDIASDILYLKNETGGLNNVSKTIGISPGMLNQFLSIFKLPTEIIELIKQRKIESVSTAHTLSKFNYEDSIQLARLLLTDGITSQELRIILPYRRKYPNEPILDIVNHVLDSKNIKVSVIRISETNLKCSLLELESRIINIVGKENFLTIEKSNTNVDLKITSNGEKIIRKKAKDEKKSFQEFITKIIS
jgi:hypothetical protein